MVYKSTTEESESECTHKSVNKKIYTKSEADNEEPLITEDPVVKRPRYFNLIGYGRNLFNKLDTT